MDGKSLLIRCGIIAGMITLIAVAITLVCKAIGTEPNFGGGLAGGFWAGMGAGRLLDKLKADGKIK